MHDSMTLKIIGKIDEIELFYNLLYINVILQVQRPGLKSLTGRIYFTFVLCPRLL